MKPQLTVKSLQDHRRISMRLNTITARVTQLTPLQVTAYYPSPEKPRRWPPLCSPSNRRHNVSDLAATCRFGSGYESLVLEKVKTCYWLCKWTLLLLCVRFMFFLFIYFILSFPFLLLFCTTLSYLLVFIK